MVNIMINEHKLSINGKTYHQFLKLNINSMVSKEQCWIFRPLTYFDANFNSNKHLFVSSQREGKIVIKKSTTICPPCFEH